MSFLLGMDKLSAQTDHTVAKSTGGESHRDKKSESQPFLGLVYKRTTQTPGKLKVSLDNFMARADWAWYRGCSCVVVRCPLSVCSSTCPGLLCLAVALLALLVRATRTHHTSASRTYGISGIPADGCDETRDMVHWSRAVLHETITWKSAGGNELCPFRCWSGANADSFSRAV